MAETLELLDKINEDMAKACAVPAKYLESPTTRVIYQDIVQHWAEIIGETLSTIAATPPDYAAITRSVCREE